MIGSPSKRQAVREPGASPGRSRRCKGRCSSPTSHWPTAGKAAEGGAPSQKTCRLPATRTPRGRRIRVPTTHDPRGRWPRSSRCSPRPHSVRTSTCASKARRRRSSALRSRARHAAQSHWTRSRRRARAASSTTTSHSLVRPVRRPDRPIPGRGLERLGVQGQRRVAAGRRRQGEREGRRRRALVLGDVRARGRPADARAARGAPRRAATRVVAQDDAGKPSLPSGAALLVDGKRRSTRGRPGLHRAPRQPRAGVATGAVRSNALP